MNATSTSELMNTLGSQAKAASALMAKAGAATKLKALRELRSRYAALDGAAKAAVDPLLGQDWLNLLA